MVQKQKRADEPKPDLYRLAEALQMRRVERVLPGSHVVYFECQLCHGRSETAGGEIEHKTDCPLGRLK